MNPRKVFVGIVIAGLLMAALTIAVARLAPGLPSTIRAALANAHAMVAAPDLLTALKTLVERCNYVSPFPYPPSVNSVRSGAKFIADLDAAIAAIAKAEGSK